MFRIVTSLGPSRIERQQFCMKAWIGAGFEVTAVQSPGEAAVLSPYFAGVQFVETDKVADKFGRPTFVRISGMLEQAKSQNILIVNSDLELTGIMDDFRRDWLAPEAKILKCGVRWDYNEIRNRHRSRIRSPMATMFKWGIDAFLITPQIAADLPDIGLAIGMPAWDYWIPWHLIRACGYSLVTNKRQQLLHQSHARAWTHADYMMGLSIMNEVYGCGRQQLADFIQIQTGRNYHRARVRQR